MKDKKLRTQIFITFISCFIVTIILFCIVNVVLIKGYFSRKNTQDVATVQELIVQRIKEGNVDLSSLEEIQKQDYRAIKHTLLVDGKEVPIRRVTSLFDRDIDHDMLSEMKANSKTQDVERKSYTLSYKGSEVYYSVYNLRVLGKDLSLISYRLVDTSSIIGSSMIYLFSIGFVITIIIAAIVSIFASRYLSKPLETLEKEVSNISKRRWHNPITLDRGDEIGSLASSIEEMRKELKESDDSMQSTLQYISHELKTPVTVIRSYAQSIEDGIYPKGDLMSSVQVIDGEAVRLEKRIKDLLYFSKIDYIYKNDIETTNININDLVSDIILRLTPSNNSVSIITEIGDDISIEGSYEQWKVAIENLINNQIRYARTTIVIRTECHSDYIELCIGNDGEPIEEEIANTIFSPFVMGKKGSSGLGLAIVKRVVDIHDGSIRVLNNSKGLGVSFIIRIPK